MEELILRYYLNLFNLFFLLSIFFYLFFVLTFKDLINEDKYIEIKKGSNLNIVSNDLFKEQFIIDKFIYTSSLKIFNKFKKVHYGRFSLKKNYSFFNIFFIITKPSNVNYKITIVEGWNKYQLRKYLSSIFEELIPIEYNSILADTYIIKSANNINSLLVFMNKAKELFEDKYSDHNLLKKFSFNELLVIASLVEKEAKNNDDKKLISSVIFNRLSRNMKLQIDATVIYALTNGEYKLNRRLTLKDLKYKHPFNTYYIEGLPPNLISYVGIKTIEIVLENYKTDFLFYFFDNNVEKHIFSKNYKDHKYKLNEYRKTNK